MRVMLHAAKITLEGLDTVKATIKDLGGTIVYHRQDSRTGGGVIAHLIVEGERAAIGAVLDLIIAERLDGFTEFGPVATMATGNVAYRVAVPGDEVGILLVFAEVAPEVPTRVYPDTLGRIEGSVATGLSWVAVDADDKVVGYALAYSHDNTIYLNYLGVSKTARNRHISTALVSKLKESGAPIVTDVRPDNKSSMAGRFARFGFVEVPNVFAGTKLRWEK
ncbi:GNAT family N-acetyltransferase [Bradyrhizobium sp. RDT10]